MCQPLCCFITALFHALFEDELVNDKAKDSNHIYFCLTLMPKPMKREYVENM